MQTYGEVDAPRILNLNTRSSWVISFTLEPKELWHTHCVGAGWTSEQVWTL
jgi:hypothetical protein